MELFSDCLNCQRCGENKRVHECKVISGKNIYNINILKNILNVEYVNIMSRCLEVYILLM